MTIGAEVLLCFSVIVALWCVFLEYERAMGVKWCRKAPGISGGRRQHCLIRQSRPRIIYILRLSQVILDFGDCRSISDLRVGIYRSNGLTYCTYSSILLESVQHRC